MEELLFNVNPLMIRWEELYNSQSYDIKEKLDALTYAPVAEYQYKVLKRTRKYPEIGNVFRMEVQEGIVLYGVVINNHIKNNNADDQLVVAIYKPGIETFDSVTINNSDHLLLPPFIITKGYWTKGYFCPEKSIKNIDVKLNYGFYDIGKACFVNEYRERLEKEPELLGLYSLTTFSGVAYEVNQRLIISVLL